MQLQSVFDAIILARVLYASLQCNNFDSLQQLFIKAKRWQIVTDKYDVSQLFDKCDIAFC